MTDPAFAAMAIMAQVISIETVGLLLDKGVLTPADARDLLDKCLLNLETVQGHLPPESQPMIEIARAALDAGLSQLVLRVSTKEGPSA